MKKKKNIGGNKNSSFLSFPPFPRYLFTFSFFFVFPSSLPPFVADFFPSPPVLPNPVTSCSLAFRHWPTATIPYHRHHDLDGSVHGRINKMITHTDTRMPYRTSHIPSYFTHQLKGFPSGVIHTGYRTALRGLWWNELGATSVSFPSRYVAKCTVTPSFMSLFIDCICIYIRTLLTLLAITIPPSPLPPNRRQLPVRHLPYYSSLDGMMMALYIHTPVVNLWVWGGGERKID